MGVELPNFLQFAEMDEKTWTLRIRSGGRKGFLFLEKGVLIDAAFESCQGEEAAVRIISWDHAEILTMEPEGKRARRIHAPLGKILMDAGDLKDARDKRGPDEKIMLERAIELAEAHHFKKARGSLTSLLKRNPRSHHAWLWYSRVVEHVSVMEKALNNARIIAPDSPRVRAELDRFNHAKVEAGEGSAAHCPFCWALLNLYADQCPSCRAHIVLGESTFTASKTSLDSDALEQAFERYSRVLKREENNTLASYYLAMAHINMERWEEALVLLNAAAKQEPGNRFYTEQLRLLLNFMASTKTTAEVESTRTGDGREEIGGSWVGGNMKKVLVVEDSPTTRKVISITLLQKGFAVVEAGNGLEALSKLTDESPNLILLDIVLPKMNGYKLLSIIKSKPEFKNTPVILLTSKDKFFDKMKGRLSGAAAYLTKPFDPEKLTKTVEKYL
ncbi:MAG: response regulator [Desulfobacterales bacterium]|nr:response regulator [Desulfobacterales bacterium]